MLRFINSDVAVSDSLQQVALHTVICFYFDLK